MAVFHDYFGALARFRWSSSFVSCSVILIRLWLAMADILYGIVVNHTSTYFKMDPKDTNSASLSLSALGLWSIALVAVFSNSFRSGAASAPAAASKANSAHCANATAFGAESDSGASSRTLQFPSIAPAASEAIHACATPASNQA
ncbi:hypothetical protein DFH09DRAFT_1315599 [Mycena vulgaris]|nr:hypothetical protein DFH09DRAFT_1315599 [Mycena vulgaris]